MGRPLPPGLSDPHRLALSQFFAGHLSAGQLSERLQLADGHPHPSPGLATARPRRYRFMPQAALGGAVAAVSVAAVGLGIDSGPHVVAAHRAGTGHNQPLHRYYSGRVVLHTTSPPSPSSSVGGAERIAVSAGPADGVPKAKAPRRKRHRFRTSQPKHVRATASSAAATPTSTGAGGATPAGTTPTVTTPTGTAPTGTGPQPDSTPSGGATPGG